MTFTDGIILLFVIVVVGLIIFNMVRKKDEGVCSKCSYAKSCTDEQCFPRKKSEN